MAEFVRITLSLTQDLKRRMDEKDGDVNWSKLAREAFEAKLQGVKYPPNEETPACDDCAHKPICAILRAVPDDVNISITQCGARLPWCAVR